jgi:hypothetical protein
MKLSDVTVNNIVEVTSEQAFEWVKTGAWNKATFLMWVEDTKQESYAEGYSNGTAGERYTSENY